MVEIWEGAGFEISDAVVVQEMRKRTQTGFYD